MGMFLIIWDHLFGTFQAELPDDAYQEKKYGLTKNLKQPTPVNLVLHEWRAIKKDMSNRGLSFRSRWKYLFGPPGWSHDGSRLTSRQLLNREENPEMTPDNKS
jgi:hypothetical protein